MAGEYKVHRVTCQACDAKHLDQDAHGPLRAAEQMFVTDDTPAGYSPDARMMPDLG